MEDKDFIKDLRGWKDARSVRDVEAKIRQEELKKYTNSLEELNRAKENRESTSFAGKYKKWFATVGATLVIAGGIVGYNKVQDTDSNYDKNVILNTSTINPEKVMPSKVFKDNMLEFSVLNNWVSKYQSLKSKTKLTADERMALEEVTKNLAGATKSCEKVNLSLIKYYLKDIITDKSVKDNYEQISLNYLNTSEDPERYVASFNGKYEDVTDKITGNMKKQIQDLGEWQSKKEVVFETKTIEEKAKFVVDRYASMNQFAKQQEIERKKQDNMER